MIAKPAPPEPPLHFRALLGDSTTQSIHLSNRLGRKTQFNCRIEAQAPHPFSCISETVTTEEQPFEIAVVYEPFECKRQEAVLFVESNEAGIYKVPLSGICFPPKPCGPMHVQLSTKISFKNIFPEDMPFHISIDNPLFKFKPIGKLKSKETMQLAIDITKSSELQRGTLTLSCPKCEHKWIYYLQYTP